MATSQLSLWTNRLRAWAGWSVGEKAELLELVLLAAVAEVAVRVVKLGVITRRLGIRLDGETSPRHSSHERLGGRLSDEVVDRRAAAVDRLYRVWPRRDACLRRGLVLGWRIRKAQPTLRIGVKRENGTIRAHAWIEVDGRVIGDDTGDYAPLHRSNDLAG